MEIGNVLQYPFLATASYILLHVHSQHIIKYVNLLNRCYAVGIRFSITTKI